MTRDLLVSWRALSAVKKGNTEDENEDVHRPTLSRGSFVRTREFRCAVADGATQSAFSALWANMLAEEVQRLSVSEENIKIAVGRAQERWWTKVGALELAWNVEMKVQEGAHATLACLNICRSTTGSGAEQPWNAIAVGDTCIFQFHDGEMIEGVPLRESSQFDNYPSLLSTIERQNERVWRDFEIHRGRWQSGDHLLVMTDALAQWCLEKIESGQSPPQELQAQVLGDADVQVAFERWIEELRDAKELRNDDTTCAWLELATGCEQCEHR